MTEFENSQLFTDLSLHEQEAISGGGFLGDAWNKVKKTAKKAVKKSLPAVLTAAGLAGLALFTGGRPTGGRTNGGHQGGGYWGGGKWDY